VAPRDSDCLHYVWRYIPNKEGLYHGAFQVVLIAYASS
jgi:hypothetical protein